MIANAAAPPAIKDKFFTFCVSVLTCSFKATFSSSRDFEISASFPCWSSAICPSVIDWFSLNCLICSACSFFMFWIENVCSFTAASHEEVRVFCMEANVSFWVVAKLSIVAAYLLSMAFNLAVCSSSRCFIWLLKSSRKLSVI